mmetsp:Transcript_48224/g.153956  ORF Transcript_48224/g.153956 Transcript_48224/m.153956 type:complete len:265 (-) Transcript_48224:1408-2202(-)
MSCPLMAPMSSTSWFCTASMRECWPCKASSPLLLLPCWPCSLSMSPASSPRNACSSLVSRPCNVSISDMSWVCMPARPVVTLPCNTSACLLCSFRNTSMPSRCCRRNASISSSWLRVSLRNTSMSRLCCPCNVSAGLPCAQLSWPWMTSIKLQDLDWPRNASMSAASLRCNASMSPLSFRRRLSMALSLLWQAASCICNNSTSPLSSLWNFSRAPACMHVESSTCIASTSALSWLIAESARLACWLAIASSWLPCCARRASNSL